MTEPRKVETAEHWAEKIRGLFEQAESDAKKLIHGSDFEIVPPRVITQNTTDLSAINISRSPEFHCLEMSRMGMSHYPTRRPPSYRSRSRSPSSHPSSARPIRSRSPIPPHQEQPTSESEDKEIRKLELLLLQAKVTTAKKEEQRARAEEDILKLRLQHATE
jgi:hypothetical protein